MDPCGCSVSRFRQMTIEMRFEEPRRILDLRAAFCGLLWLVVAPLPISLSAEEIAQFQRPQVLSRFDANHDGILARGERRAYRAAHGGMDVPMLPAGWLEYDQLPARAQTLQPLDNTPIDNPLTNQGATLGRVLFYDRQLSRNNTVACASCHRQSAAFADPRRVSVGFKGDTTGRNAMGLANLRFSRVRGGDPGFFWDERAQTLEAQVLQPIQDPVEMGMTLAEVEEKLAQLPYYPPLFKAAYGTPEVSSERIAMAIADFLRALVSFGSRYDATQEDGSSARQLSPLEEQGRSLFIDGVDGVAEVGCAHCHVPPTFNMPLAMNNGLELLYEDAGLGLLARTSNDPFTPSNDGKFKAPSLRNIALTAPYMHDGRFKTLEQVVEHYSRGIHPHPNVGIVFEQDGEQQESGGFQLSRQQVAALVAFLESLTDNQFVADPRFSDPFVRPRRQSARE